MINIFGTSGIRGILGKTHTVEDIINIIYSINEYFKGKNVIIGYDCRKHSLPLAYIASSSLLLYGTDVVIAGVISTPSMQLYLKKKNFNYGIMFTASHNPKQYFGLKVFDDNGIEVSEEVERKISDIYYSSLERPGKEKIVWEKSKIRIENHTESVIEEYIEAVDSLFPTFNKRIKNFKIAADYCNCSSINTAGRYLSQMFPNIIHISNRLDGRFPSRDPEPNPDNIRKIVNKLKGKIDIGVSFDGDGDRGVIFDGYGKIYWGDEIGVIVSLILKDYLGIDAVVTPISSSTIVNDALIKAGIDVIWTKVGAKNVVNCMLQKKINLGFEENGGLIYLPHISGRDGLITLLFTLKAIEEGKTGIWEIRNKLPKTYVMKQAIYVENDKNEVFNMIKEMVLAKYDKKIENSVNIDGIKLFLTDKVSILIRPSGTEPKIRVFTEADTKEKADKICTEIIEIALESMKKLA